MTDLTEQFENDKLAKGTYYCRSKLDGHKCLAVIRYDGELYDADYNGTLNKGYWEVLAPVPSYDEWQEKLRALNAAHKAIKMEDKTIDRLVYSGRQCNYEKTKIKTDCRILAQKLLQVKPELREWLEVNYGEYL